MARLPTTGSNTNLGRLFRSGQPVAGGPGVRGKQAIPAPHTARRNPGAGALSKNVAEALVTMLYGGVSRLLVVPTGSVLVQFVGVKKRGTTVSPSETGLVVQAGTPVYVSQFNEGWTYYLGLAAMGEALTHPREAVDLLEAYAECLAYASGAHLPQDYAGDPRYTSLFLRAADELYYWLAYGSAATADPSTHRWDNGLVEMDDDVTLLDAVGLHAGAQDIAQVLTDVGQLRAHQARGATLAAAPSPAPAAVPAAPPPASGFKGWQYPMVVQAVRQGRNVLLVGPTGSGKTYCWEEMVHHEGQPYELVQGMEGLLDLDFVGAIVPRPPRLEFVDGDLVVVPESKDWVDGPVTRALRRALEMQRRVYLFVDELTRIPRRQLAILIGMLNPRPAAVVAAAGITPTVKAGTYYVLEIPMTGERLAVPTRWFAVAAACNVGRQYAVDSLDPALLRRLHYKIEFGYLEADDERDLLASRTGVSHSVATRMVRLAAETRRQASLGELPGEIDTGSMLVWADVAQAMNGAHLTPQALWTTATVTWLATVAGRDVRGRVEEGNALGLRDLWADTCGVSQASIS